MSSFIVVLGNLADGYRFVGPFDGEDTAIGYIDDQGVCREDWQVVELAQPKDKYYGNEIRHII